MDPHAPARHSYARSTPSMPPDITPQLYKQSHAAEDPSATREAHLAPLAPPDTEMTGSNAMLPTPPASLAASADRLDMPVSAPGDGEARGGDLADSSAESESADREGDEVGRGNTPPFAFDGVDEERDFGARQNVGSGGDVGMSDDIVAPAQPRCATRLTIRIR